MKFLIALLLVFTGLTVDAQHSKYFGWETGDRLQGYFSVGSLFNSPHDLMKVTSDSVVVREGTYAGRFEVKYTDVFPTGTKPRAEIQNRFDTLFTGYQHTIELSVMVPTYAQNNTIAPFVVYQCPSWNPAGSPGDGISIFNGYFYYGTNTYNEQAGTSVAKQWRLFPVVKGKWYDFMVYHKFRLSADGQLKLWVNGTLATGYPTKYAHGPLTGAPIETIDLTGLNMDRKIDGSKMQSPYPKFGIYIWNLYTTGGVPATNVMFYDKIAIHDSTINPLSLLTPSITTPSLSSLSPSTRVADSTSFTLLVNGANFANTTSTIYLDDVARTTTFVSSSQLSTTITAAENAYLNGGGTHNIKVVTQGNTTASNILVLSQTPATPVVTSIQGTSSTANGLSFSLKVNGTNFIPTLSQARWNGVAGTTTFVNAQQLLLAVTTSNKAIANGGTVANVDVLNTGNVTASATQPYTLIAMTPVITSISPASNAVTGSGFTLSVTGDFFISGKSTVYWNSTPLTTTFVDQQHLTAAVTSTENALINANTTASITVQNTTAVAASGSQTYNLLGAAAVLTLASTSTNVTCYNGTDGSITITQSGGTLPVTYLWNDGVTLKDRTNLKAGLYTVTATDASGSPQITTVSSSVNQPLPIKIVASWPKLTCRSCKTTITLDVSGGTAPYTGIGPYTNVGRGTYTYTVTDATGCKATVTVIIKYSSSALTTTTNL